MGLTFFFTRLYPNYFITYSICLSLTLSVYHMRLSILFALFLMFSTFGKAQTSFMPPSWSYNSTTKVYSQNDGLTLYKHELSSQHFDVYYGTGYGTTPPEKLSSNNSLYVNVKDLLEKAEQFFDININKLKFADLSIKSKLNEYKMIICILHDTGWTATGSGYDNKIGALWITPSTCHPVGQTIAHEIGHAFQYQVYCDLGGNTGFRTPIGNGATFWEQTAQWQSVMSYPELKWGQSWSIFPKVTNYAMTHEWMRYQSYWWHYYLAEKYGVDIIGRMWRYNPTKAGDPNESLMGLLGIDSNELYKMYFEYAMKMATLDLDVCRAEAAPYINTYTYNYVPLGGTCYQVAYSSCPQSTGFNVIQLSLPKNGNTVATEFTSLKSPVKIAEGDEVTYFDGDAKWVSLGSNKTYYNINSKYNNQRAFRLGYVALLNDGSRKYIYADSLYCGEGGTGSKSVRVEAEVPANTKSLYLVVVPTPRVYIQHKWNEDITDDDQWPYTVEFENTNIAGAPIISEGTPICNATFTYDVTLPRDGSNYGSVAVALDADAKAQLGTALQMNAGDIANKLVSWSSAEPKDGQIKFYAVSPTTGALEKSGSTANGYGHWFDASGKVCSWGNTAYIYSEFDPASITFNVGQYPAHLSVGKTYTVSQALKYTRGAEQATIKFVFNVNCVSTSTKASYTLKDVQVEDPVDTSIKGVNASTTSKVKKVITKTTDGMQVVIEKDGKRYNTVGNKY